MDLRSADVAGELQRANDAGVFGDVVGLDPEVVGDRRIRDGTRIARIGPSEVEQRGTCGRRAGITAGRAIGPHDEAEPAVHRRLAQSGAWSGGPGSPWRTGSSTFSPVSDPPPRSLRQAHCNGS